MLKQKAFTLIEMLIVIVIIGILAAALVPRLQDVQTRARDTKRKADISQIHSALMVYELDNGGYPQPVNVSGSCAFNSNCYVSSYDSSPWLHGLTGLIATLPVDPINNGTTPYATTGQYSYLYGNVRNSRATFALFAKLENTRDADRCAVQKYKWYRSSTLLLECESSSA